MTWPKSMTWPMAMVPELQQPLSQTLPFPFVLFFSRSLLVYLSDICTLGPKLELLKGDHSRSSSACVNKLEESVNKELFVCSSLQLNLL